jgi:hypothetical protein
LTLHKPAVAGELPCSATGQGSHTLLLLLLLLLHTLM